MRTYPLAAILLTIFIDLVGIGILIPVIPQILGNPESPHYMLSGASGQYGYILLGLLTASYPLSQFFAAPLLGQLSDRYGRKPILLFSIFGTAIGYALFASAIMMRNIELLFASRILDGLTGGNISVAQATIADLTPPEKRAKNFGLMGAIFGIGFIIGPFIGGQLSDTSNVSWFSAATPFWFAALLCVINMFSIWFLLTETNFKTSKEPFYWGQSVKNIAKAFAHPVLRPIFTVGFLFWGGFTFFTTFFGVYLIERFGFSESNIGNFFAYVGIWIAFTQGFVTAKISKRFSERKVLNITFIGTGLSVLLYAFPGSWIILLFATPVFAIFNGLTQANFTAFLSRSASEDIQGEVLGINASVAALAQAIPPVLSGFIAARFSAESTLFIASAVAVIAGILFVMTVRDYTQKNSH